MTEASAIRRPSAGSLPLRFDLGRRKEGKASAWLSDDLADFLLEAEHVVRRDMFGGLGITAADRLKHESLFLRYLIEPRHQRRESPHRNVKDPKREVVVVV